MARSGQHADIGTGAKHAVLPAEETTRTSGCSKRSLSRVGELDIDAKIVGIELELVALEQRRILIDVHRQRGDVSVERQASNGDSATDRS